MLFELSVGGHYPGYIQHLVQSWCKQKRPGQLSVVVSPQFIEHHADVVAIARDCEHPVSFVPITAEEASALVPRKSPAHRAVRAFQTWQILCNYASALGSTHCLMMYLDSFQSPLAVGAKAPCSLSGIYFRPTFHYHSLTCYQPSWKDRVQHWRERFILPRVLRHPKLQTVFCLDPFVIQHLQQFHGSAATVPLADPVQSYGYSSQSQILKLQEDLEIQPNRLIGLMFGGLDGRKGIFQLLNAILMLSPALCQKLCLVFVGSINPQDKQLMQPLLTQISELPVQIKIHDTFIPDHEIQRYFQMANVILAPYQRHVGMSAILVRAAYAQKPVLSSNYGLMGELTRSHRLGLAVDSTSPSEIAQGLTRFLNESPLAFCDRTSMRQFAEQNSVQAFTETIFQHLLSKPR